MVDTFDPTAELAAKIKTVFDAQETTGFAKTEYGWFNNSNNLFVLLQEELLTGSPVDELFQGIEFSLAENLVHQALINQGSHIDLQDLYDNYRWSEDNVNEDKLAYWVGLFAMDTLLEAWGSDAYQPMKMIAKKLCNITGKPLYTGVFGKRGKF